MEGFSKGSKFNLFRILTMIILLIVATTTGFYYTNSNYNTLKNDFFAAFNNCEFENAKQIFNTDSFIARLTKKNLEKDLNNYFTNIVNLLCKNIVSGNISSEKALVVLREIQSYNILNSSIDKLIISLDDNFTPQVASDYNSLLDLGITNFNNKNYEKSIEFLSMIPENEKLYSDAQECINKCKTEYKQTIFADADKLVEDDYYTQAIDLLYNINTNIISSDDSDLISKINYIENARDDYLSLNSYDYNTSTNDLVTSSTILECINVNNVNTLNISSDTKYLVYVDLTNQTTNIYTGSINNWELIHSFSCSSGTDGENTPIGIYSVTDKGEWFYSKEYEQGGKYWVQFLGDYLFHSYPYDETQTKVLDYTLGEPSSHGCIRLDTDDAKWIYDNIDLNTKVIIN